MPTGVGAILDSIAICRESTRTRLSVELLQTSPPHFGGSPIRAFG